MARDTGILHQSKVKKSASVTVSSETRLSLLDRARLRDEQAWRDLVDLYSPLIVRWCQRSHVSADATADCIQEVFAAVSRALDTFHAPGTSGAFRGWLWTITRNKLRDAARRSARQISAAGGSSALAVLQQIPQASVEIPSDEPSQLQDIDALMLRATKQIEAGFAANTWQAFWRTAVDGIATDAVAQELNLSTASVRQARSRIMRRLRQQLGDIK